MKLFNAFQITCIFSGLPFVAAWLDAQEFRLAGVAFWVAIAAWHVAFIFNVAAVHHAMDEKKGIDW